MFKLRYYCQGEGDEEVRRLLSDVEAKHNIPFEILDLSRNGAYDEEKEKQVYETHFKPRARILKKRTRQPITKLRSRKARHYFVSRPGTIAVIRNDEIEWYTLGVQQIADFLKTVLTNGCAFLEECSTWHGS